MAPRVASKGDGLNERPQPSHKGSLTGHPPPGHVKELDRPAPGRFDLKAHDEEVAMSDLAPGFGLADAIPTVRAEFEQAIAEGNGIRPGLPRSSLDCADVDLGFR